MDLPWRCQHCQHETMIDLAELEKKSLDTVMSARGYACEKCGKWQTVAYTTVSLEEQMRKLARCTPENPKFSFLFKKTLRKAIGVNLRGELLYG